jgi:hypothetical protein
MTHVPKDVARAVVDKAGGVLRLEPAWVAREWLPPGRRLGLPEAAYDLGERGAICERWLASTTRADNRVGPPGEGLSRLQLDELGIGGDPVTLAGLVAAAPAAVLGVQYAATHDGLGRLAKIFDFGDRIPYHIHPRRRHSELVGRNPKDEAYYFPPGHDLGPHPESFFGVHPWITETGSHEVLLPYLEAWDSDLILRHAQGTRLVPDTGFHIPSGILHAPGTALTIELQEDSDCLAMFQALNAGRIISKDLLFKDVRDSDREAHGERFLLEWVDWEANGDPWFFENHHTPPVLRREGPGLTEHWIYYDTTKFSGKRLTLGPGSTATTVERGVHSILVTDGEGTYAGVEVRAGDPRRDELLVVHDRAVEPLEVRNKGRGDLVVLQFFGPDINPDVPVLRRRRPSPQPLGGPVEARTTS